MFCVLHCTTEPHLENKKRKGNKIIRACQKWGSAGGNTASRAPQTAPPDLAYFVEVSSTVRTPDLRTS
jgi:hypothetical protein